MVLKVEFEKEFERKFRELAMRKFGFSKGAIKKASEEAIEVWIEMEDNELPKIQKQANIRGILKAYKGKYTSVELQHEARKLWANKK